MTFCATGTPILHAETSFISAERRLRQGILSRTSFKCCIHFGFILKLTIFICKQLKRPVAFGTVQKQIQCVMSVDQFWVKFFPNDKQNHVWNASLVWIWFTIAFVHLSWGCGVFRCSLVASTQRSVVGCIKVARKPWLPIHRNVWKEWTRVTNIHGHSWCVCLILCWPMCKLKCIWDCLNWHHWEHQCRQQCVTLQKRKLHF